MTQRADFRLLHRMRVRWAEVDMQNIVFNAHYLMYMDVAVTEYWRACALPFSQAMERLGGDMVVRKATVEFIQSARMDDVLDIGMRFVQAGRSSMAFAAAVFRGDEVLATGDLVYVYTAPHAKGSQPVPQALRDVLTAFETRQPMTQLQMGSWAELQHLAMPVREQVFVVEQGIPAPMVSDAADDGARHVVVSNLLGMPLATGRLVLQAGEGAQRVGKVGRMAVLHPMRNGQFGGQMLAALVQAAREADCHEVILHAQKSAVAFYLARGFVPRGDAFEEVGISHQEMVMSLAG